MKSINKIKYISKYVFVKEYFLKRSPYLNTL